MSVTYTVRSPYGSDAFTLSMQGKELFIDGVNINQTPKDQETYDDLISEGEEAQIADLKARLYYNASYATGGDELTMVVGDALALKLYHHKPLPEEICLEFLDDARRSALPQTGEEFGSCVLYIPGTNRYWDPSDICPQGLEEILDELTQLTSKHG